jgi:hypothetical protein
MLKTIFMKNVKDLVKDNVKDNNYIQIIFINNFMKIN